ncbi:hypothetical protein [Oxalobacter paraformigenes]|uniref:Uncharacterized protein n=1 Tax=Oxalobacter paraformigenes TaxID=556268 RepID=C3X429_9BURK|nr:hypothetical protein [Oxalobacter paraformigenes]EEO27965.1 hypothetical protein OFAG_01118 [Oxalobacter paraformigenes]
MGKMTLGDFFKTYREHLWGKERKKRYYWGFMGDILGELILPTDEEIIEFAQRDFTETVALRYFLQPWIMPDFYLFTEESKLRIRDTLAWYLHQPEKELDSIVNAFQIPIPIASAKQFYTVIWQEFFLSNFPDPINPDDYEEDTSPEFINSLYKTAERPDWSDTSYYASPERIGTVRTDLLEWYSPERTLDEMKLWATTGIRPNNIKGLMSDAAKWLDYYDMNRANQRALNQFGELQENGLYVDRLTLTFEKDIGIGFFKGTTKPVKTRRARFLFDRLGNLLTNYPILK